MIHRGLAVDVEELVAGWLEGRASVEGDRLSIRSPGDGGLAGKCRRAYAWLAERAIHTPCEDIEFGPERVVAAGAETGSIVLTDGPGYASFLLLPLLALVTNRRLLILGGPGRGKTTVATLMGLLTGQTLVETRRSIQHGHPQLTIADLLGSPLPSQLIKAESAASIEVAWRRWIGQRVKIIDEYNRIPTKTQSALLSLMADGYAEMYEQVFESPPSAWFLTANDDAGGGTFPVIEALRDRIDLVVRCTPFHARHLERLVERIEDGRRPEAFVPADLVFSNDELDRAGDEVRTVAIPTDVVDSLGFFAGQLDFCRRASDRLEAMNKDTLHLSGRRLGHVCNEDCPLDKNEHLCTQSENGVSARAYQTLIHLAKALAWFRGAPEVEMVDVRALVPWVLFDKVRPNLHSPFFQKAGQTVLGHDRAAWLVQLLDRALTLRAALAGEQATTRRLTGAIETLADPELRARREAIAARMEDLLAQGELSAPIHDDLVALKAAHHACGRLLARRRGDA